MMEIYTPEQAARILQVNVQTLRRWLRSGELTGANTTAGWRLTPADLEAWLNKNRQPRKPRGSTAGLKQMQPQPPQKDDEDATDRAALALADIGDFEDWQTVKARNGL